MLTLLQTACAAADGAVGVTSLRDERLASGVDDAQFDRVVSESVREEPGGRYRIPGAEALLQRATDEVQTMLAPLNAAGVPATRDLGERAAAVSAVVSARDDLVIVDDVARLTARPSRPDDSRAAWLREGASRAGDKREGDSLRLVVMDAHRELNALQARIATESIDGARVYDLAPGDRDLVRASMRGVHSTERLRFDHPGLGTIATRTGPTLLLQNDLGTTDAHVLVIRVSGLISSPANLRCYPILGLSRHEI